MPVTGIFAPRRPAAGALQRLLAACLLLWLAAFAPGAFAQKLLPIPELSSHVIDATGTLTPAQKQTLEVRLVNFEQATGSQVAVLLVQTTAPEDIAAYANRVGNAWKIGRRAIGDGVVLLVAKRDRKVRIEVAKALEGAVPDLAAKDIIDEAITPAFRKNDYAGGLLAAVERLETRIRAEALPAPTATPDAAQGSIDDDDRMASHQGGTQWFDMAVFLFLLMPVLTPVVRRVLGRPLGSLLSGGAFGAMAFFFTYSVTLSIVAAVVALLYGLLARPGLFGGLLSGLSSTTWSSGGGRSSSYTSGGGFRSGGGGNFGGGGASGDW